MKGKAPNKEEKKWLNSISQLGCIICLREHSVFSPASPHHIDGRVKKGAHLRTIPLCFEHHQSGKNDDNCVSRHPYKSRFEERYGTEQELLFEVREMINGV